MTATDSGVAEALREAVRAALFEDLGDEGLAGDVTSVSTVPATLWGEATVLAKAGGVACGLLALDATFGRLDSRAAVQHDASDGDRVRPGQVVARVTAPVRVLLTGERTALNLITHLSGVATMASTYAAAAGAVELTDIRKTLPGLRALQKYAVRCGGGHNHRMSLRDGVLIKDNHVVAAGGAGEAVRRAKACTDMPVEIEVDTLQQLREVLDAGADAVLLDNFTPDGMREAVRIVRSVRPQVLIEVSGGVTLQAVAEIASTGVDRISVGALTHSAPALDFSFELVSTWERP